MVELFRSKLFDLAKESRLDSGIDLEVLPNRIAVGLVVVFSFFYENQNLFLSSDAEVIKTQLSAQITDNLLSEQRDCYFRSGLDMNVVAESLVGTIERTANSDEAP